jgi:transposase
MTQRVQVITGVERRRRFTAEEKQAMVAEADLPGASVSGVAKRHGIATNLLFQWRKALQRGSITSASLGVSDKLAERLDGLQAAVEEARQQYQGKVTRFGPLIRAEALALLSEGLTAAQLMMVTTLSPTTLSHWQQDGLTSPGVRELKLIATRRPLQTSSDTATVRIGASLSVELPVSALASDELWQQLLKIGKAS